ncbi:MAG: trigger factor [Candidatus Pacebacteria bacterium]|nr:trigger factor [Candidatus Paceibacterota bacterium]
MKSEINDLEKSQKEIIVEISTEEMEKYMEKALEKMSKNVKADGFRAGKVPKDVAKKQIGELALFEEATHEAIESSYLKIIEENKLSPIGHPKADITKSALGNPLEYKIIISVLPEVKLGDYTKISGKIEIKEIEKGRVEKESEMLQKKRAKYITKDAKAEKGDRVEIDFESRVGGVKIEGGESKNHPLVIGEGKFIPGFEDNLVGMSKDDIKKFSLIFPEDYKKELAGKNVDFKVELKIVQKVELPELNDEFAKSLGKFENVDSLKKSIKDGIMAENENKAKEELKNKLIDQVSEKSTIDIPDVLIDSEIENMLKEFENNVTYSGIKFEDYLVSVNTSVEKLKVEWREMAEKRVKTGLVMREISVKEEIKLDDKEIEERVNETLKHYPNAEEMRKNMDIEKYKNYVAGIMINEKVFEILEVIAEKNGK